jgi:outer membrane receptor protein involved in Fe transport
MFRVSICFVLAAAFAANSWGQAVWGSISGYVTDPAGASIPQAKVSIANEKTGLNSQALADSSGFYNVTNLVPGLYTVSVEGKGFARFTRAHVNLQVDATVRIDPKLELGLVPQAVTVAASSEVLKSEKSDVAQTFAQTQIESLPVVGRNLTQLYVTVPGVISDTTQMGAGENPSENRRVYVNGTWSGAQEYILDGITDLSYGFSGLQVIVPPQDSVQEMKATTADYDPEFGSTAGMVAQYVTKSGTNEFHGSAFWFNRNSATFAADPLTEKIAGTGKDGKGLGPAPFNWNQGGFSLGAPIKKNKVFAFGDYQFNRTRQGASILSTVPNDAFRSGDFSALVSTNPIYDPLTGNPDGTGRQPLSCNGITNVICPNRIDPVAKNLLGILPRANINQNTDLNYVGSVKEVFNQNSFDLRGDWNISDKDKFFARYSYFSTYLNNPPLFGVEAGGPTQGGLSPEIADSLSQHTALNYTHTFGSSLLTEVRAGFVRFHLDALQADSGLQTNNKLGIPNINTGDPLTGGLAGINIAGPAGGWYMGIPSGVGIPRFDRTTTIEAVNNWTKISGSHQFRWGVDIRRHRFDFLSVNASSRGNFSFCQAYTGAQGVPNSGLGMATFLLGSTCSFDRAIFTQFPGERQTQYGVYWQDVWRVGPKLTLNYGLRYDYFEPVTPRKAGGIANFDPSSGQILLGGLGDVSNSANITTPKTDFSPRIGVAYKVTQNTVIRAGLGRSYFSSGYDATFYHLTSFYPIISQQSLPQPSLYQALFPLEQGPPPGTPPQLPTSGHLTAPNGTLLKARPFDWKTETMDSWNFTIERAFAGSTTLSVGYVGAKGTHLSWQYNMNAAPSGVGPLLQRRPFYQLYGLSQGINMECNCSDSNYNALQVQINKRFTNFYTVTSNFTWSKALSYSTRDPYNRRLDYGPGGNSIGAIDRAGVWTTMHLIQIPYGTGFHYGGGSTGLKKAALAGWQFSGITSVESGLAFTPTVSSNVTLNGDYTQVPDRVPGADPYAVSGGQNRSQWYNPAAFSIPNCCRPGNASTGMLRGPGIVSADWALWKEFAFASWLNRESTRLQFRWEMFNALNNTNLNNPVASVDSRTAGRITSLIAGYPMRRMEFGLHLAW